jgi:surfeit locus 1 family protein
MSTHLEFSFLRSPKWISGVLIAGMAIVLFVNLGLWQLRRLDERGTLNTTITERMTGAAESLDDVLVQFGPDPEDLEYRRVVVSGTYQTADEVILQARSQGGRSGNNVLTPLVTATGDVLVVDRGWVPIDVEGPPVAGAVPAALEVTVTGILRKSETFGPLGDVPATGPVTHIGRIDLPALADGWGVAVLPVSLALEIQDPGQQVDFPVPLPLPDVGEGPHLGYAIQWFLFAMVVAVGFPILVIRTAKQGSAAASKETDTAPAD